MNFPLTCQAFHSPPALAGRKKKANILFEALSLYSIFIITHNIFMTIYNKKSYQQRSETRMDQGGTLGSDTVSPIILSKKGE